MAGSVKIGLPKIVSGAPDHDLGPLVVWLTNDPRPRDHGIPDHEYAVRIVVDIPRSDAHPWAKWARAHEIDERYMAGLKRNAGSGAWRSWFVCERRIPTAEWETVEVR